MQDGHQGGQEKDRDLLQAMEPMQVCHRVYEASRKVKSVHKDQRNCHLRQEHATVLY